MQTKTIKVGMKIVGDTRYRADRKRYDIYPSDATTCTDRRCFYEPTDGIPVAFLLKDVRNVTLDFCGAHIVLHGKIQPFIVDRCENVRIENCIVEFAMDFWMDAEIRAIGEGFVDLLPRENFAYRIENGRLVPYGDGWESDCLDRVTLFMQSFDRETRDGCDGVQLAVIGFDCDPLDKTPPLPIHELHIEALDSGFRLRGNTPSEWKVGNYAAFCYSGREISSVLLVESKNCTVAHYRIVNGAGMGILAYHTDGIRIDGLRMVFDELSHGIISNNGDAAHLIGCGGEIVFENSVCEGLLDDVLNVHNNFMLTERAEGNVLVAKKVSKCFLPQTPVCCAGDEIAVYRGRTMERKGTFVLRGVTAGETDEIALAVDRPTADVEPGDMIENVSQQPTVLLRNNAFRKSNTHLRFQSRGKITVEDCDIGLPVLLTGDATYWFESSPCEDFTVRNCRFTAPKAGIRLLPDFSLTEKEPYYHKNITVENSEFVCDVPLSGTCGDNIVFRNNRCARGEMRLELSGCGKVTADCRVER